MSTYAYVNTNGVTRYIDGADVNFRGQWVSVGTYEPPFDAVDYSTGQFIALAQSVGVIPTAAASWSPLVLYKIGPPVDQAAEALALAQSALNIACIGTNVGTNAYNLAVTGSNLAYQAIQTQQVLTGTISDPNSARLVPFNPAKGCIFYQDPILAPKNEWKWSLTQGTWIPTPL